MTDVLTGWCSFITLNTVCNHITESFSFEQQQRNKANEDLICQYFLLNFSTPKEFDRKSRREILKIERRNLEDFHPRFAVKLRPFYNLLIISTLQNGHIFDNFVNNFYQFYPI